MSELDRVALLLGNRLPLQSKKFIAFQISNLGWLILIGLSIWYDEVFAVQMAMVLVAGFIQAAYIGGQSVVDIYASKLVPSVMSAKLSTPLIEQEGKKAGLITTNEVMEGEIERGKVEETP